MSQGSARPKNRAKETGGKLARLLQLQQGQIIDLLTLLLVEARLQTLLLHDGLHIRTIDPDKTRAEISKDLNR